MVDRNDNRGDNNRGETTERDGGRHNPNSGQVLHPETDHRLKENGGDGRGGGGSARDDDRGGNNRTTSSGNNRSSGSRDNDGYTTERDGGRHSPNSGQVLDPAHDGRLKENRDNDDNRGGNTTGSQGGDNRGGNHGGGGPHPAVRSDDQRLHQNQGGNNRTSNRGGNNRGNNRSR